MSLKVISWLNVFQFININKFITGYSIDIRIGNYTVYEI